LSFTRRISFTGFQGFHVNDKVQVCELVRVVTGRVEGRHEHFLLGHLALQGLQGGGDHALELGTLLPPVGVKERDGVSVLRGHGVGSNILDVGDQEVAVFRPSHGRAVYVLDHEPEEVVVPLKDKVPQVPFEEVLCSVEQGP